VAKNDSKALAVAKRSDETLRDLAGSLIYEMRGRRVVLDADIADFFGKTTSAVNQQRSRNQDRFPEVYAFQLSREEWNDLKSQSVVSSSHGGRRSSPWAYTEHGFAMLATRMRGDRAAHVSQIIIETFVSYRRGTLPATRAPRGAAWQKRRQVLQDAIYGQMQNLLTADLPTGDTVSGELQSITASAINRVKAVLDAPVKKNEHVSAEIRKLEAETAKAFAEARKTDAESASIWADVYKKRLDILERLRQMALELERDEVMGTLDQTFGWSDRTPKIEGPAKE